MFKYLFAFCISLFAITSSLQGLIPKEISHVGNIPRDLAELKYVCDNYQGFQAFHRKVSKHFVGVTEAMSSGRDFDRKKTIYMLISTVQDMVELKEGLKKFEATDETIKQALVTFSQIIECFVVELDLYIDFVITPYDANIAKEKIEALRNVMNLQQKNHSRLLGLLTQAANRMIPQE